MVKCFMVKCFVLCAVKATLSYSFLDTDERDAQHIATRTFDIISCTISSVVGYQFLFFSYCVKCRHEVLVAYAQQQFSENRYRFRVGDVHENIQLIELVANLHFKLSDALADINASLSIEVGWSHLILALSLSILVKTTVIKLVKHSSVYSDVEA